MNPSQSHKKGFSGSGLDDDVNQLPPALSLKPGPNRAQKSGCRSMNIVHGFLNLWAADFWRSMTDSKWSVM